MSENDMNTAVAKQPALIQTHNLSKKFGEETAVQDLNLTIPQGAIFGFIGTSGCGKTTTVRLLLGIYDPTAGEAAIFEKSPQTFGRAERERIGSLLRWLGCLLCGSGVKARWNCSVPRLYLRLRRCWENI